MKRNDEVSTFITYLDGRGRQTEEKNESGKWKITRGKAASQKIQKEVARKIKPRKRREKLISRIQKWCFMGQKMKDNKKKGCSHRKH